LLKFDSFKKIQVNPQHNDKMASSVSRFHSNHVISEIVGNGARCRTCAVLYSLRTNLPWGFCRFHKITKLWDEAKLGRFACELQEAYVDKILREDL
jgi:hypothetical protein